MVPCTSQGRSQEGVRGFLPRRTDLLDAFRMFRYYIGFPLAKLARRQSLHPTPYRGIGGPQYPFHDKTVVVTNCGRLCLYRKKINLSTCLAGQAVGIKEVDDGIWLVSFMHYDLGYVDWEKKTLLPLENLFGPNVLPIVRSGHGSFGSSGRIRTYNPSVNSYVSRSNTNAYNLLLIRANYCANLLSLARLAVNGCALNPRSNC
jgi:hypothetical protein